ncbi:class I SAM-dependent methyltransferase [Candidatus Woesearchaeota archaeon]|nr:class I SAM-dependent methyltransferase [Candidatus Woesearchaeota archaeon]
MKKNIKMLYREWAKDYDSDSKRYLATAINERAVVPLLAPKKSDTILDIGCGTGRFTIPLAKRCRKIVGVDFSDEMLDVARRRSACLRNTEFINADITKKLPFRANTFDKVLCILVVDHVMDLSPLFREVRRVLKPGGKFLYDDVMGNAILPFDGRHKHPIAKFMKKGKNVIIMRPVQEHIELMAKHNFKIEKMIPLKITARERHCMTKKSFRTNKGKYHGLMFLLKK